MAFGIVLPCWPTSSTGSGPSIFAHASFNLVAILVVVYGGVDPGGGVHDPIDGPPPRPAGAPVRAGAFGHHGSHAPADRPEDRHRGSPWWR